MSIGHLLIGFRGRISRGQFWMGLVMWVPIALSVVLWEVLSEMRYKPGWSGTLRPHLSPNDVVWVLAFFIPVVAISVKRLHDRGRSGWWSLPLIVAPILILFFATPPWHRGNGWSIDRPWDHLVWSPPALWIALLALAVAILIAWVVELGIRYGTPGPNRYGPAEYKAIGSAGDEQGVQQSAREQQD